MNGFIQVLKVKPSALVWGLSDQQRTMMIKLRDPGDHPPRRLESDHRASRFQREEPGLAGRNAPASPPR